MWQLLVTWKAWKGVCSCMQQNPFIQKGVCDQCYCMCWVRVGCDLLPMCLACHCLVASFVRWSDGSCVSCDCLWTSKGFSIVTDLNLLHFCRNSESRSMHDWTHRVGSQRQLELATTCSDPPHTCTMQSQCPCTFLYKFYSHCEGGP